MSEVKGIIQKWLIYLLGTSWQTTLYGILIGGVTILSSFYPDVFSNHSDKIIIGVGFMIFGYTVRTNKVNDEQAGVPHKTAT